ncbi:MAG: hypothetical protein JO013_15400 [Alphaproteobacteria bacterium]|nr:hypothetical protein [Alphaproteobacteria bacterium]
MRSVVRAAIGGVSLLGAAAAAGAVPAAPVAAPAASAPAAAPAPAPSPANPDIVVTGRRDQAQQVADFVAALTPAEGGAIPRFVDQVCPAAAGLLPEQNAAVAARLRQVARAVGLKAAPEGCAPNAFVVVTQNKRAFMELLAKRRPQVFGFVEPRELRRLAFGPERAAAWQIAGAVDRKDKPQRYNDIFSGSPSEAWEAVNRARGNPRGYDAAVLVVELKALEGLTATQVADYAAMRLLARLDPKRLPAGSPPTILAALEAREGAEVPVTLTRWDAGFLKGLYGSGFQHSTGRQRAEIGRTMTQGLAAPQP